MNAPFCLAETKQKGRVVVAIQPIPAYRTIVKEASIATVLYVTARESFCSYCTDKLITGGMFLLFIVLYLFFLFLFCSYYLSF